MVQFWTHRWVRGRARAEVVYILLETSVYFWSGVFSLLQWREDPECLKRKFREVCNPETNVTMERHSFNTRNQKPGETIEAYVSTLRNKAKTCNFGALTDELIRDRLVCGIDNDSVRRGLLRESDLTLAKAIKICQISELTEQHTKVLAAPRNGPTSVDTVHYNAKGRKPIMHRQKP